MIHYLDDAIKKMASMLTDNSIQFTVLDEFTIQIPRKYGSDVLVAVSDEYEDCDIAYEIGTDESRVQFKCRADEYHTALGMIMDLVCQVRTEATIFLTTRSIQDKISYIVRLRDVPSFNSECEFDNKEDALEKMKSLIGDL